ncbi:MAG: hypothetical protein IPG04_08355 [Polyangiaceae bacterium]|nr:hypothetical protein [Polyangiaceae bacterium]
MPLSPGMHVFLTSDNFTVEGTSFKVTTKNTVSDELVRAIDAAEESIHIASGHLRSRPVSEALMRKAAEDPGRRDSGLPRQAGVHLGQRQHAAAREPTDLPRRPPPPTRRSAPARQVVPLWA